MILKNIFLIKIFSSFYSLEGGSFEIRKIFFFFFPHEEEKENIFFLLFSGGGGVLILKNIFLIKIFSSFYSLEGGGHLRFVKYSSSSFLQKKKKKIFSSYYSLEGGSFDIEKIFFFFFFPPEE